MTVKNSFWTSVHHTSSMHQFLGPVLACSSHSLIISSSHCARVHCSQAWWAREDAAHSSVTFTCYWPGSRCDIIGISNGPADAANRMTIGLVMGWPTVKFKWPPVGQQWGWWANELADRASWSDHQLADSGVGGLMGWPTWQDQVITSRPTVGLVC